MDGNNRWAKKKGLPNKAGYRKGAITAKRIMRSAKKLGIKYLTLYAFSSENWHRPEEEVTYIMSLLKKYLKKDFKELAKEDVRIRFIGDFSLMDEELRQLIYQVEEASKDNRFNLVMAISYGSRDEIRNAAMRMVSGCIEKKTPIEEINPVDFDGYLYTANIPDPDLFIRPGGELRISNFLLWQSAYSEFYFTPVLWPDFKESNLMQAIEEYSMRERRYGVR
jgi:undecaprenyl diphosphate synthase